jgi:hypothetical protein
MLLMWTRIYHQICWMSNDTFLTTSCQNSYNPLTLSKPILLPPTYFPALIYCKREGGWWVTCNYPTVLKEKNINRKVTTCAICWLKCVLQEEKRWEQENQNVGRSPTFWFSCKQFSFPNVNLYTVKHSQLYIPYYYLSTGLSATCFGVPIHHHQAVT